ncbi:serine/threonine-protein kinase, partial [Chondromyces apiculatus]|uniref:serine/threonine-protein kinase n=1 Tax=Chondromyces apiculatus TaxID=51 RepID=UPI0006949333
MNDDHQITRRERMHLWGTGSVVGGRFRLLSPLGAGAMGEVWRAQHLTLATPVAVKLVDLAAQANREEAQSRFLQEAQAAARLQSPHVVRILDQGVEGQVAYLAMELLDGENLAHRLARCRRLPPAEIAALLRDLAHGLGEAHQSGTVHRDIKPANIFFARTREQEIAKLLDFGIAKIVGAPSDAFVQTQAGLVLGTPAYMSPEQVLGRPVDHRSDLWQLGVLGFECLTGSLPFHGNTLGDLFMQVCGGDAPQPSRVAGVSPTFDAWFARAVAKNREARFGSAADLADAFAVALKASANPTSEAWAAITGAANPIVRASKGKRSVLVGAVGGVLFATTALTALVIVDLHRGAPDDPAAAAPNQPEASPVLSAGVPASPAEPPPPAPAPTPAPAP